MAAIITLLLLLVAVMTTCSGSLVMVNLGVEVPRGGSVFITEKELKVIVDPNTDCKVEVVMNEPVTQRVGRLTPQVRSQLLLVCTVHEQVQSHYCCCVCRCLTAASWRAR